MIRSVFVAAPCLCFIAALAVIYKTIVGLKYSSAVLSRHEERILQGNVTSFYSVEWHATHDGTCADEPLPNITLSCNGGNGLAVELQSEGVSCGLNGESILTVECAIVQAVAGLTYTVAFTCTGSSLEETTAEAIISEQSNDCLGGEELAEWGHGLRLGLICDEILVANGTCTPSNTTFPDSSCGAGWFCPDGCPVGNYRIVTMTSSITANNCADFASSAGTAAPSASPTIANDTVPVASPAPFVPQSNMASFYTAFWSYSYEGSCANGIPMPTIILKCNGGEGIGIETRSQGVTCDSRDGLSVECNTVQAVTNSEYSVDFNCMGWSLNDTSAEAIIPEQSNSCLGGGISEWSQKVLLNIVCDGNGMVNGTCSPLDTTQSDQSCAHSWSCSAAECPADNFTTGAMASAVSGNNCMDSSPPTISPNVPPTESPTRAETLSPSIAPVAVETNGPTDGTTIPPTNPEGYLFVTSGSSSRKLAIAAMMLAGLAAILL